MIKKLKSSYTVETMITSKQKSKSKAVFEEQNILGDFDNYDVCKKGYSFLTVIKMASN